jgi:uncharacterized protein YyaL (SSP411 family)
MVENKIIGDMFLKERNNKNKLKNELSPYLLQHSNNPVNWYPWGNEAFNKAKKENKPIFLSIGYSTCHWCHVMAHESFEDDDVAKLLNNTFVCIKVDREERPDIDKIYMNICQMITGHGGWPLTIFMTPDKKPFFAGTYIPKKSQYGIKGLLTIIPDIKKLWENKTNDLLKSANQITELLQKNTKKTGNDELSQETLNSAYEQLFNTFDELYGGFGNQPKFPSPHNILFLLRYWKRSNNKYSLKMVINTLEQMRMGGIYDHIGFGFHRYSTDRKWILPHFEKMLYDQALLIMAYTETYQATQKQIFKKTAQEIIEYILRDMTSAEGGFYSAEDADSEGIEGKFYYWNYEELKRVLTNEELNFIEKIYNIGKEGNYKPEVGKTTKNNIFYQTSSIEDHAKFNQINEKDILEKLEEIRKKIFKTRKTRIHPEKDDKILTDWNGLMIAALAKSGQIFNNKMYIEKAENALNFILKNMMKKNGYLLHTYRKGKTNIEGYADDYAFLIWGLIELYQATFNPEHLKLAIDLNNNLLKHFWDKSDDGLFFTSDTNEKLLSRTKEIYDGAIPSSNSVTMYNLIILSRITGNIDLEKKARQIGKTFSSQISKIPSAYAQMMVGLDFMISQSFEIVIVGKKDKKETQKIIESINSIYLPNKVIILKETDKKDSLTEKLIPFIKDYNQIKNKATIYVCKNQQCQLPVTDIENMKKLLI